MGRNNLHLIVSPGRSIVASAVPKQELYDMQLTDHECRFEANGRPEIWNERVHDVTLLRNRFDDLDLATRLILAEA